MWWVCDERFIVTHKGVLSAVWVESSRGMMIEIKDKEELVDKKKGERKIAREREREMI